MSRSDYLLASDMEMVPQPGYDYANWYVQHV